MQPTLLLSKSSVFLQPNRILFLSTFLTLQYILLHCELLKGRGCLTCFLPIVLIAVSGTQHMTYECGANQ